VSDTFYSFEKSLVLTEKQKKGKSQYEILRMNLRQGGYLAVRRQAEAKALVRLVLSDSQYKLSNGD
jgi:hypothetical protein